MPIHPVRFFIVKHDRTSFLARPGVIWRTDKPKDEPPKELSKIEEGDIWMEFAYIEDEVVRKPCSEILGFYRCTDPMAYEPIPQAALAISDSHTHAWAVKGKPYGQQPNRAVTVPPIDELLERPHFKQTMIVYLDDEDEFERIRALVLKLAQERT